MRKLFLYAAAAATFASCSNNELSEPKFVADEGEIQLQMLHPGQLTRATDTAFEDGDSIGVYVTNAETALQLGGNEVNDELFTFNGTSWTSKRKVYWNAGTHNIYAYYPYSRHVNDVKDYAFSVLADQSAQQNYSLSDFLWGTATGIAASNQPVSVQFSHRMSNVIVKLQKGENFDGALPSNAEVYLYSTVLKAAIDLSTGDVAKDNYAGTGTIRCLKKANDEYRAIVVPQSITSRRPLVEVIVGNVSYLMEGKINYRPGYRHTITVTLDKNPEKIRIDIGGEIAGW